MRMLAVAVVAGAAVSLGAWAVSRGADLGGVALIVVLAVAATVAVS